MTKRSIPKGKLWRKWKYLRLLNLFSILLQVPKQHWSKMSEKTLDKNGRDAPTK